MCVCVRGKEPHLHFRTDWLTGGLWCAVCVVGGGGVEEGEREELGESWRLLVCSLVCSLVCLFACSF